MFETVIRRWWCGCYPEISEPSSWRWVFFCHWVLKFESFCTSCSNVFFNCWYFIYLHRLCCNPQRVLIFVACFKFICILGALSIVRIAECLIVIALEIYVGWIWRMIYGCFLILDDYFLVKIQNIFYVWIQSIMGLVLWNSLENQ